MRGRVMALWFVAFQGSTPIGGPIVGWVMAGLGARAGLGLGAVDLPRGGAGRAVACAGGWPRRAASRGAVAHAQ